MLEKGVPLRHAQGCLHPRRLALGVRCPAEVPPGLVSLLLGGQVRCSWKMAFATRTSQISRQGIASWMEGSFKLGLIHLQQYRPFREK